MKIIDQFFEDVLLLEPKLFKDERGLFFESYSSIKHLALNNTQSFVQDNFSYSLSKFTLRGLHFQLPPFDQAKLITVFQGKILDVFVDIRHNSKTFGQYKMVELDSINRHQLLIPCGFAHGFCTLENHSTVFYKVDNVYSSEHDRGIKWNDPDLNIPWPCENPVLSKKDEINPSFKSFQFELMKWKN